MVDPDPKRLGEGDRGRLLMVVENDGVPQDRRVWDESRTLSAAGWQVVVVCPHADFVDQPDTEVIEGIEINRYPLRPAASTLGYVREYAQALWRIRRIVRRLQREQPFDVVHASNPPDFLFLALRAARTRGGRFIFDHHDLAPELFRSRFGRAGLVHWVLLVIERRALRSADVVISSNDSYRRIAIERGGVSPEAVFVVRNGPDLSRFLPVAADPALRGGRRHLLAYLGIMGPQDGIDYAVGALAALRKLRADDWRAVFVGNGEVLDQMRELANELGMSELVEFAGWRDDDDIRRILSTADVCLAPDPPSPLNDLSTMVKVPEYMAMGRPIVSYDLPETRVSAGPAAVYAESPDPESLARCIARAARGPRTASGDGTAGPCAGGRPVVATLGARAAGGLRVRAPHGDEPALAGLTETSRARIRCLNRNVIQGHQRNPTAGGGKAAATDHRWPDAGHRRRRHRRLDPRRPAGGARGRGDRRARQLRPRPAREPRMGGGERHVTVVEGDVCDRALVAELTEGIDVVFHQAAIRITQCAEEPRLALEVLVDGTFNVVEAAAAAGVRKLVAASSASVYGLAERVPDRRAATIRTPTTRSTARRRSSTRASCAATTR